MVPLMSVLLLFIFVLLVQGKKDIEDPFNIFCGSADCYDILNLTRADATAKDIKKAYRKLSLQYHPDKNKEESAEVLFIAIAKAAEVLSDPEQKELFDYYLDHPREYYKVTGKYYFRALPKADVRIIIVCLILFFSVLLHIVQYQKWQRAVEFLRHATINNLGLKNGGTKETLELLRRAEEKFKALHDQSSSSSALSGSKSNSNSSRKSSSKGEKCPSGSKMLKDPLFSAIVDEVVGEVKIEGGYKKPTYEDVLVLKLMLLPYHVYVWGKRKFRVTYQESELTAEECLELTVETLGAGTWEDMTPAEQSSALQRRLWQPGQLESFEKDRDEECLRRNPALFKRYNRHRKKEKLGQ